MKQEAIKQRVEHVQRGIDRGWAFTPLIGKRPYRDAWQAEEPADHDTAIEWARRGNIALRTGQVSGVVVIDDDTEGGSGTAELELPETVTVVTGSGKRHFYFRCPEGRLGNSAKGLPQKVDVRGDGGCVVFVGSIHPDTGDMYRWAPGHSPDEIELAELPESVLARLKTPSRGRNSELVELPILSDGAIPQANPTSSSPSDPAPAAGPPPVRAEVPNCVRRYAKGVLRNASDRVAGASPGGRNNALNREAFIVGRYVGAGAIEEAVAMQRLTSSAARAGLTASEAGPTARSGLQAGMKEPVNVVELKLDLEGRSRLKDSGADGAPPSHIGESPVGESPGDSNFGTELWFARRLLQKHGHDLRFVGESNRWFRWHHAEGRWQEDVTGEVHRRAKDITGELVQEVRDLEAANADSDDIEAADKVARKFQAKTPIENSIKLASTESRVIATREQWDRDPWLLHVANGTLDLTQQQLRSARREDYITKRCPVSFRPEATAPLWESFLERILPDEKVRDYVQRFFGYALTGEIGEHVMHVFWGSGANGKSTLLEAIRFVHGDYGVTAPPTLLMQAKGDKHPTDQTMLHGARLAISTETPEGGRLDENTMKSLTGGDTITARRMREDFWSYEPTHKLVVATNHRPRVTGNDEGVWRRLRLVPFEVKVPEKERDPHLLRKLKEEAEGILVWLLHGIRQYQERRLDPPEAVRVATAEYRECEDTLGDFVHDCLEQAAGGATSTSEIHDAYRRWCDTHGIPDARRLTQRSLTTRLQNRGFVYRRTKTQRGFEGVLVVGPLPARGRSPRGDASVTLGDASEVDASPLNPMPDNGLSPGVTQMTHGSLLFASRARAHGNVNRDQASLRHQASPQPGDPGDSVADRESEHDSLSDGDTAGDWGEL